MLREKRVLLIDDEPAVRRNLTMSLMQEDYEIEPCENGVKGLNKLEMYKKLGLPIDCVITDLRLPDIDGVKILKTVKNKYPKTPVVVITGYGDDNVIKEIEMEECDGYLDKPFNPEELISLLAKIRDGKEEVKKEEKPVAKTVSSYVMMKFSDSDDLVPAYRDLYFMDNVLYCDATRGEYDIVLLVQASDSKEMELVMEKVKKIEGIDEMFSMAVKPLALEESLSNIISTVDKALGKDKFNEDIESRNPRSLSSYVFLEIEKEKFEGIFPTLHFTDNVVYCDITKGKYDIVMLIQGQSFEEIDRVIDERIRSLDGVVRIKECPIIKMFEM